jgi:hypothetical protein
LSGEGEVRKEEEGGRRRGSVFADAGSRPRRRTGCFDSNDSPIHHKNVEFFDAKSTKNREKSRKIAKNHETSRTAHDCSAAAEFSACRSRRSSSARTPAARPIGMLRRCRSSGLSCRRIGTLCPKAFALSKTPTPTQKLPTPTPTKTNCPKMTRRKPTRKTRPHSGTPALQYAA